MDSERSVRLAPRADQIQKSSHVNQAIRMRLKVRWMFKVRCFLILPLILLCGLAGCQNPGPNAPSDAASTGQGKASVALQAPAWDAKFRSIWDDGAAEVSTYTTQRMRGGSLRKGTATVIVRRATFSEDDRVAEADNAQKAAQHDLFPVMQMNWVERYAVGLESCDEMTSSVVTLSSVDGRAPGTETKDDFSAQSWDGQLFHQLLFDTTGIRSHQYSFQKEGDEQTTLSYPRDGVAADALWFWARGMAAPRVDVGQERVVDLLPRLRDVREKRQPLSWYKATLTRRAGVPKGQEFLVRGEDGHTETFEVEDAAPFRVMHWENSDGEHAELVNSNRMKTWDVPAAVSRR